MKQNKSKKDIITEKDYTVAMSSASSRPEDDSPGDSTLDAGAEALMGMGFMPNMNLELEDSEQEVANRVPIRKRRLYQTVKSKK